MIAFFTNVIAGGDFLLILPFAAFFAAFWIWMLVDCAKNEKGTLQVGWILAIILGPVCLGALLYLFCRKLPRSKSCIVN